ncbi:diacylglycerol/lipid kinase family protein [Mesobacillus maritimus]|uniref:Diacylglycerol kinase family lipid kinase n=1 Tax=Mesobacillus maritimus TaxID=1643336 RepID=A0ABS7K9M9_9BACI|nr:diacylglycerol kinase family protein [Mesobacillus maritimus]MBY0098951.1 diacylglycerol kinase family lipid kinase [Mesobacillus maritimus]
MKQMYFIINLQAKNGRCRKVWEQIEQQLTQYGTPYKACYTEYSGHAVELTKAIAQEEYEEEKTIVVVGGDGTLHEVVNGAIGHSKLTIGFIPGGSGNDFSRGFGIPQDPLAALKLILDESPKNVVDIGRISAGTTSHYFINNMGVGFDAAISDDANHSKLKAKLNVLSLGSLAYAFIVIKKLFTYQSTDMWIKIDEQEKQFKQVWFVTLANQVYYGGGMKIAPNASATDGLLDVIIVHNLSRWKLLSVFISVFWGGHTEFKEVCMLKGKKVSIQTQKPVIAHADGEIIGNTPMEVEAVCDSLTIITGKLEGTG